MKHDGEIMEILAAYDLTGSLRATAELTGCSHHTVAKHVAARDAGRPIGDPTARGRVTDPYLPKIEEWVEASKGRIRADKAHAKLFALGYTGSERSTRRAIAQVKSRIQRLNPVDGQAAYNRTFGDLVALEQRRKALLEKAAGAL